MRRRVTDISSGSKLFAYKGIHSSARSKLKKEDDSTVKSSVRNDNETKTGEKSESPEENTDDTHESPHRVIEEPEEQHLSLENTENKESEKLEESNDDTHNSSHEDIEEIEEPDKQQLPVEKTETKDAYNSKHVHFNDARDIAEESVAHKDKVASKKESTDMPSKKGKNSKAKFKEEKTKTSIFERTNPDKGHYLPEAVASTSNGRKLRAEISEDKEERNQNENRRIPSNQTTKDHTANGRHERGSREGPPIGGSMQLNATDRPTPTTGSFGPSNVSKNKTKPNAVNQQRPPASQTGMKNKGKGMALPEGKNKREMNAYGEKRPPASRHCQNLEFYLNRIHSLPYPGHKIEEMLRWKGKYRQLEVNHRYIQWLFPTPESSAFNSEAQPLHEHEMEAVRGSSECSNRFIQAYEMMLDFYGIQLENRNTGEVKRCQKNWKKRFAHLNKSGHNYLRITRIILALSCLGFGHFQRPLIDFFLNEILVTKELSGIRHGAVIRWIESIENERERYECLQYFEELHANCRGSFEQRQFDVATADSGSATESDDEGEDIGEEPANTKYMVRRTASQNGMAIGKINFSEEESEATQSNSGSGTVRKDKDTYNSPETEQQLNTSTMKGSKNKTAREKRRQKNATENETDEPSQNLEFYRNKLKSKPDPGWKIVTILGWENDFYKLQDHPHVIQWLFPILDSVGKNPEAQPLQIHEIEEIRKDKTLSKRFLKSYKMMLGFYGMKLTSDKTGEVTYSKKWKTQFEFLSRSVQDHMRITRILQSLECFGFWYCQYPFISFMLNEIVYHKHLRISHETVKYWIEVMTDEADRQACYMILNELSACRTVDADWDHAEDDTCNSGGAVSANTLAQHKPERQSISKSHPNTEF